MLAEFPNPRFGIISHIPGREFTKVANDSNCRVGAMSLDKFVELRPCQLLRS